MEEHKEEHIEEKKIIKKSSFKWLIVIGVVIGLTILIIIASQNTDLNVTWIILIGLTIILSGVLGYFGFNLYSKFKKLEEQIKDPSELPKPINDEELFNIANNSLTNPKYANHIDRFVEEEYRTIGGNLIKLYKIEPAYDGKIAYIIINANYPERKNVLFDPSIRELNMKLNLLSTIPERKPDTEVQKIKNPLLGSESETIKTTYGKKDKEKKHKEEEIK
ncbi:hypothetical protein CL617_04870 [archaeon]|nr:hypothetical protein [archaeon]|tara:strand:- start:4426 stop:5085 length:660 start_codon:yes stop_codon:yes gene_type:complete